MSTHMQHMKLILLAGILVLAIVILVACQAGKVITGIPSPVTEVQPPQYPDVKANLAAGEALRIMPLGDSIVEGFCDKPANCNWPEYSPAPRHGNGVESCDWALNYSNKGAVGYREFLREKLEEKRVEITYVGSVDAVKGLAHEGHSGFTIGDIDYCIENAGWLEEAQPDLILLLIGANDVHESALPEEMIASLERVVGHIYSRLPETTEVIITQIPPERTDLYPLIKPSNTLWNDIVKPYNDRIPEIGKQFRANGKHVSSVDMWGVIQSDSDLDEAGIHPEEAASERIADIYLEKIMEILDQQP